MPNNHGGARTPDKLGRDGKMLLVDVVNKWPKMPHWFYASVMTFFMGHAISTAKIDRTLRELALSTKKATAIYSEALTDVVYNSQQDFLAAMERRKLQRGPNYLDRAYFVDVVSFKQTDIHKTTGLAPLGERFIDALPSDRASTTSFGPHIDVCSCVNRAKGVIALVPYEGHTTAAIALNYFRYALIPKLQPGDDVYLDGASYWGGGGRSVMEQVRVAMRPMFQSARVNVFWLPARSPLFNPDEMFNGWLKRTVQTDVVLGRANPFQPKAAIVGAVRRENQRLVGMCKNWVARVYGN